MSNDDESVEKKELTIEEHFSAVLKEHGARLAELASSRHTRIEAGLLSEETGLPMKLNEDEVYIPWSYYVKFKDLVDEHLHLRPFRGEDRGMSDWQMRGGDNMTKFRVTCLDTDDTTEVRAHSEEDACRDACDEWSDDYGDVEYLNFEVEDLESGDKTKLSFTRTVRIDYYWC